MWAWGDYTYEKAPVATHRENEWINTILYAEYVLKRTRQEQSQIQPINGLAQFCASTVQMWCVLSIQKKISNSSRRNAMVALMVPELDGR